jgi:hypothetical protein
VADQRWALARKQPMAGIFLCVLYEAKTLEQGLEALECRGLRWLASPTFWRASPCELHAQGILARRLNRGPSQRSSTRSIPSLTHLSLFARSPLYSRRPAATASPALNIRITLSNACENSPI